MRKWIRLNFAKFLRTFKEDANGSFIYEQRIQDMITAQKQSLEITFHHLSQKLPSLAIWIAEEPECLLPILNEVAWEIIIETYPNFEKIHDKIFVRIKQLPIEDKLRDLRQIHLNSLVKIRGVVTKRSMVHPELTKMYFRCMCGDLKGPIFSNNQWDAKQYLGSCVICQSMSGFTLDEAHTVYRNYQKITV